MFPFARYLCIFTFPKFCSIECILKCLIKDCFNHSRFLIKPIIPRIIQNHIRLADAYIVTPIIILVSPSNFDNNDFKSFCKYFFPKFQSRFSRILTPTSITSDLFHRLYINPNDRTLLPCYSSIQKYLFSLFLPPKKRKKLINCTLDFSIQAK